MMAFS
jgi:hypothetical protein